MFERPNLIREQVYSHLRRAVLEGQFAGGTKLSELELVGQLEVSRTPIREALQKLTQEGLLEGSANRSVRVRQVSSGEARETYAVREVLDALAARTAALEHTSEDAVLLQNALHALEHAPDDFQIQTQLDLAFHQAIARASHNTVLMESLARLEGTLSLVKVQTRTYNARPETRPQHRAILEAILQRDAEQAALEAALHVRTFAPLVVAELERVQNSNPKNGEKS